jgi:acyl dehydratase
VRKVASRHDLDVGITITDEAVEDLKKLIGVPLRCDPPWNTVATRDNIRHWAWGIGDDNPLWLDEEYAKKTRWGCIIAPPTMLNSFGAVRGDVGLPGLHGLWTEDEWEFFHPVRVDDAITVSGALVEVLERRSEMAGRMVEEITENVYRNQKGEIVAKARTHIRRFGRAVAAQKDKHKATVIKPYTEDEIRAIEEDYDKEEIRGANSRYWEDVQVGDSVGHVVKGPLAVTDIIAFHRGCPHSPFVRAHRFALAYRRRHPRAATLNELGVPDVPERVHWEGTFAKEVGAPAGFDYGYQRIAWATQLFTNWMGDDGFLRKLHVQIRGINYVGDTTWFRGKVASKLVENGEHLVQCEFWSDNQRGERTTRGWATVSLPSRAP